MTAGPAGNEKNSQLSGVSRVWQPMNISDMNSKVVFADLNKKNTYMSFLYRSFNHGASMRPE
jgi:hypothetical protein